MLVRMPRAPADASLALASKCHQHAFADDDDDEEDTLHYMKFQKKVWKRKHRMFHKLGTFSQGVAISF